MSRVVCLIGEPGVGKSTLFERAFGHLERGEVDHRAAGGPMRELLWEGSRLVGCELGRRVGKHPEGYPGTDTMSMTAITGVDDWLRAGADALPLVALEGTRLANKRFVDACQGGGHLLQVFYLYGPDTAAKRRQSRGSKQNAQWLKGRQTAARNFYDLCGKLSNDFARRISVTTLPAHRPLEDNARYLRVMAGLAEPVS